MAKMPRLLSDEASMMPSLQEFFSIDYNFEVLAEFINGKKPRADKLTLGLLDWFNVNYSKKYNTSYCLTKLGRKRTIYVWQAYNAALNGYGKERFDPFARGKSQGGAITLTNEHGISVTTTLRQLNYFRWAIENGVIAYVREHLEEIHDDFITRSNRGKSESKRKLAVSASKELENNNVKITVSFK